jgi:hypothetical protein
MSVYLCANGASFLVDSGTYTYRSRAAAWQAGEPEWRRYLRGPAAHNGLSIEEHDPLGEVRGDFRGGGLETFVTVEKNRSGPVASWIHSRMLGGGPYASHRRGVVHVLGEYFVVYDLLSAAKPAAQRHFGFQFSPDVEVARFGSHGFAARKDDTVVVLVGSSNLPEPLTLVGSRDPLGGWVSRRYGELLPAAQARFPLSPETTSAAFLVRAAESPESETIEAEELGAFGIRITVRFGEIEDLLLLNLGGVEAELDAGDLRFTGDLVWIRSRRSAPSNLRWLNGARLEWSTRGIRVACSETSPNLEIDAERDELAVRHGDVERLSIQWRR